MEMRKLGLGTRIVVVLAVWVRLTCAADEFSSSSSSSRALLFCAKESIADSILGFRDSNCPLYADVRSLGSVAVTEVRVSGIFPFHFLLGYFCLGGGNEMFVEFLASDVFCLCYLGFFFFFGVVILMKFMIRLKLC